MLCASFVVQSSTGTYFVQAFFVVPVVPHKAVAEVSKIGKAIGGLGCCESGMAERIH